MINASYSTATWRIHQSALNCYIVFCRTSGIELNWPIKIEVVNVFTNWALTSKKLKASTVESYLKSLSLIHKLKGFPIDDCLNYVNTLLLKGAKNLEVYSKSHSRKNVMTLPLLKILGHGIATSNWSVFMKQTFWTVACLAFFGSLRMGEIIASKVDNFDPGTILSWKDVKVREKSLLIHIKSPKSRNRGGDFVDIFEFAGHGCCPVKAFKVFEKMVRERGFYSETAPVFRLENGKLFTKTFFNQTVAGILNKRRFKNLDVNITGHSFRAAIPAMLARFPELSSGEEIMGWGRWGSKAYLSYTRLKIDQKKKIYDKIVSVLNHVNK